ncbi:MAG TPA: hypothetical protein VFJ19_17635 [Nocardioidaceae bacterium]|nr:hypothetical protein [Nocardioidaceae bacterium]
MTDNSPVVVDPAALPQGAAPAVPLLDDGDHARILRRGKAPITVTAREYTSYRPVRVKGGFLVYSFDPENNYPSWHFLTFVGYRGQHHEVARGESVYLFGGLTSPDGRAFAIHVGGDRSHEIRVVRISDGTVIADRHFPGRTNIIGYRHGRVLLRRGHHYTRWWDTHTNKLRTFDSRGTTPPRDGPCSLPAAADLSSGHVPLLRGHGDTAIVSVPRHPQNVWWLHGGECPVVWSPNDEYVLTLAVIPHGSQPVETVRVRRADDGRLVREFQGAFDASTLAWEDGHTFLGYASSTRSAVVRCTVAGDCERATGLDSHNEYLVRPRAS